MDSAVDTAVRAAFPSDRIRATIYGQCIGDTLGLLTEFLIKDEAKKYYKDFMKNLEFEHKKYCNDMHRARWKEGDWTDDTDQMLLILQSILENEGKVDYKDFARRIIHWKKNGFPEFGDHVGMGIGSTTFNTLKRPNYEDEPHENAQYVWETSGKCVAPNGGLMRTSILGIHCYWDLDTVHKNTIDICKTTHADPRCQASCVAVTSAIALMLQRNERHVMKNGQYDVKPLIKECFEIASRSLDTDDEKKELKTYMKCKNLKDLKLDEHQKIGYTYKCLGAGFWALKQSDFRSAIQDVVMEAGDADTNACVAGALLGCKLGVGPIPDSWKSKLLHKEWLDEHIERFMTLLQKMILQQSSSSSVEAASV